MRTTREMQQGLRVAICTPFSGMSFVEIIPFPRIHMNGKISRVKRASLVCMNVDMSSLFLFLTHEHKPAIRLIRW